MVTSKQLLVLTIVAIVVLVPLTAFAFLIFPPGFMYDHYSTYSYTTSVSTNATVENATILLPFPDGTDVESNLTTNLWIYDDEGNQLTDWDAAVVDTVHGPMLRLRSEQLAGEDNYVLWTYDENGSVSDRQEVGPDEIPEDMTNKELVTNPTTYSISWQQTVNHDIDTRHPIGNATFIAPITDAVPADCQYSWDDEERCTNFSTVASMTYDTDDPAAITIGEIRYEGWNEWGFWLSNSFNTFESTVTPAVYTDDRQGWTTLDGHLHAGLGRYDGPSR